MRFQNKYLKWTLLEFWRFRSISSEISQGNLPELLPNCLPGFSPYLWSSTFPSNSLHSQWAKREDLQSLSIIIFRINLHLLRWIFFFPVSLPVFLNLHCLLYFWATTQMWAPLIIFSTGSSFSTSYEKKESFSSFAIVWHFKSFFLMAGEDTCWHIILKLHCLSFQYR